MKRHLVRYTLGAVVALFFLGHVLDRALNAYEIGFVKHLDAIIYDAKLNLTMPGGVDGRIVILDIDERSLSEIGRWPWNRERLAALVDKLFDQYGVTLLGFDVIFAEPDDSSGLVILERLARGEFRESPQFQRTLETLRPRLEYDKLFAKALGDRPTVLGFYGSNVTGGVSTGALPAPVFPGKNFPGRPPAFFSWSSHGGNLEAFQKSAANAGHVNPVVDFDGVIRRVPMIVEYQGNHYASLSLAMLRQLLGNPAIAPGYPQGGSSADNNAGMEWIDLPVAGKAWRIPVDDNVAVLIPYRGVQGSFPYISITDVLHDRVKRDHLKGRIAIVGTTAPGLKDLRSTPVGGAYAAVEIHANIIAGILDNKLKHRPQYMLGAEVLLLLSLALIMIFIQPRLSPLRGALMTLGLLLLLALLSLSLWQYQNIELLIGAVLLMTLVVFALNMSYGYFVETRAKRQFTDLFGQYVPPELVEEMSRNPESYSMEGRNAELTVLFSDIRGFTTISEGLEAKELTHLMNEYLSAMTEVIRHHRGTLDKYIGDAIMAFWGAPVHDPEHARQAVLTALDMQQAIPALNRTFVAKGWPEVKIGVGINTGAMTVGDMGSVIRKAYTVMGDAVNLSSRLEGITKQYGAAIIVGEATRNQAKGIVYRELDRVRVKGKAEPVAIYEPAGKEGSVAQAELDELKLWHQALRYYRAQDWDQTDVALLNLTRMAPQRELYSLYLSRIAAWRKQPPGADWDGVTSFETK